MPDLITRAELDKMPRTPGICAYCKQDTMVYALIEFTCRKCVLADMEAHGEVTLTRAEAAYAHLASFQHGDQVDVGGRAFFQPGTVTTQQQDSDCCYAHAYLIVTGCGAETRVTVGSLLSGEFTITSRAGAAAGKVRYFDPAGYAAQTS